MPVAEVETQGLAGVQGLVAVIRLTQQPPAHLMALGCEVECCLTDVAGETAVLEAERHDKLAAQAERLNDHADSAPEYSVVLCSALAGDQLV